MTNNQPEPAPAADSSLDRALIDLYESGLLHGEAQANGVGVTLGQRNTAVLLAVNEVQRLLARQELKGQKAKLEQLRDEVTNRNVDSDDEGALYYYLIKDYTADLERQLAEMEKAE